MTSTTNLGLTLFESSDKFRIQQSTQSLNKNMQILDEEVNKKATKLNPEFTGYLSRGRKANTTKATGSFAYGNVVEASGSYSFGTGSSVKATGLSSHAEGGSTEANGQQSHAEGYGSKANGNNSHAEGSYTTAGGVNSHAEGYYAKSPGAYSHAEGYQTEANHKSQHVFGEYNVPDPSSSAATQRGNYVEIVGAGTPGAKKNVRTLDWEGNERLSGDLIIGCNDDSSGGHRVASGYEIENMVYAGCTMYDGQSSVNMQYGVWYHQYGTQYICTLKDSFSPSGTKLVNGNLPTSSTTDIDVFTLCGLLKSLRNA